MVSTERGKVFSASWVSQVAVFDFGGIFPCQASSRSRSFDASQALALSPPVSSQLSSMNPNSSRVREEADKPSIGRGPHCASPEDIATAAASGCGASDNQSSYADPGVGAELARPRSSPAVSSGLSSSPPLDVSRTTVILVPISGYLPSHEETAGTDQTCFKLHYLVPASRDSEQLKWTRELVTTELEEIMLRASSVSRVLFNSRHNHARFRARSVAVNFSEPRDLTAGNGDGEPMAESAERYIS